MLNTNISHLEGEFGDTLYVKCNLGHIHAFGQPINYTHYEVVRQDGYLTQCLATGQWDNIYNCVCEWTFPISEPTGNI